MTGLNPYVLKKHVSVVIIGSLCAAGYFVGLMYYGLFGGAAGFLLCLVVSILLHNILVDHPFRAMSESKGIALINMDSTGVVQPIICAIKQPFVMGRSFDGRDIKEVFDRDCVTDLAPPVEVKATFGEGTGDYVGFTVLAIPNKELGKVKFGLNTIPCFIWNSQLGCIVSKTFIASAEKTIFAEHTMLQFNRVAEDLNKNFLNFARYVVDALSPKDGFWASSGGKIVTYILIALFVGVLGYFMIKTFMVNGGLGMVQGAVQSTTMPGGSGSIIPMG